MRSLLLLLAACSTTTHKTERATLGKETTLAAIDTTLDAPGPLSVETIAAADWVVPLKGLLNLERAGLADRDEPINVFVHVVKHPTLGTFLVDSGIEQGQRNVPWMIRKLMPPMITREDTQSIVKRVGPINGVFLTHVHLDHVLGLTDLPAGTPVYTGRGDASARSFQNLLMQGIFDTYLGAKPLRELAPGVIDLFGDGSFFAIAAPGHTPGSTAYLARTTVGPVLMTGDACHTRHGWEHAIEPGEFSMDQPKSRESLLALIELARRHPAMSVRLGHQ